MTKTTPGTSPLPPTSSYKSYKSYKSYVLLSYPTHLTRSHTTIPFPAREARSIAAAGGPNPKS